MALDFPDSPTTGDEFDASGKTWVYDGVKWGLKKGTAYSQFPENIDAGYPTSVFVGLDSVELGLYNTNYGGLPTLDAGRP